MAGIKISALPAIPVAPALTDIFPEVQPAVGGTTYKTTFQQLLTLYQASATNFTGLTGVLQAPTQVNDVNGNPVISFGHVASAVNYITAINSATGNNCGIVTDNSSDTNVNLQITAKGTGAVVAASRTGTMPLTIVNLANGFNANMDVSLLSASRNYQWPNAAGVIALTSNIPSFPLSMANGGTNASLTAANGAIPYSTATAIALLAAGASGQLFQSGGVGTPNWTTATYPSTTTINQLLYSSSNNVVAGLATVNSASLVTSAAGVPTWLGSLTNGQLVIGSTGAIPVAATLTAGPGVSIANGAGSITISGTGSGIGWTEVTGTTQAMVADSAYVANNAGLVTLTLPATAAFGTAIVVLGKGAGGWTIAQNANQNIQVGSSSSTVGVGGSVSSTNRYDSISMICITANTTWSMYGAPQGNLTIV